MYCACAGLRLARFNTMVGIVDKRYFMGLPSPAAAALAVGFVYICTYYNLYNSFFTLCGAGITLLASFSMVSNVKFYSFKEFHFHHKGKFTALLIFLMCLTLLLIYPEMVIYGFFFGYTLVSYINCIFGMGIYAKLETKPDNSSTNI